LVHFSVVPKDFVLSEIHIPSVLEILRLEPYELPAGWNSEIASGTTQREGNAG
jgi:DNA-directed RNA polymerase subunit H (RpoH/RPB5)